MINEYGAVGGIIIGRDTMHSKETYLSTNREKPE
jgi:hypothetical protein